MTSLNHDNNLCLVTLYFPTTSASGSGVPYCKSQETEIQKAKEELKKLESKSSDESEEHKKQIAEQNGKIKKAQDAKNDCAKTHSLSDVERQKGLNEVKQQRKIVEKLETFTNELKNTDNNILTHLCDGLETFLGFDSASKGYDGTGIVYSDLDRLCDGVMGCLSGVLEAVKNENEVTTYDNKDGNDINKLISDLNKNIGSGRDGLAVSVEQVKGWLEGYERETKKRIDAFKMPLDDLKATLSHEINIFSEAQDGKSLTDQLANWGDMLEGFVAMSHEAERLVKDLDSRLMIKCEMPVTVLKTTVELFKDTGKNKALIEQAKSADETLEIQEVIMIDEIKAESKKLQLIFVEQCDNILNKTYGLNSERQKQFANIMDSISMTISAVGRELGVTGYTRNGISNVFDELKMALQIVYSADRFTQSELRTEVNRIKSEFLKFGAKLGVQIVNLDEWKKVSTEAVAKAMVKCKEVINKLQDNDANNAKERYDITKAAETVYQQNEQLIGVITQARSELMKNVEAAQGAVITMNDALRKDLKTLKSALLQKVNFMKAKIADLHNAVGGTGDGTHNQKIASVIETIFGEVKRIKGEPETHEDNLEGIKKKVLEFAEHFAGESTFASKVLEVWIQDILKEETGTVKEYLKRYIDHNNGINGQIKVGEDYFKGRISQPGDLHETIKAKVIAALKQDVYGDEKLRFLSQTTGGIDDVVNNAHLVCKKFADTLEKAIDYTIAPSSIVTAIDGHEGLNVNKVPHGYDDTSLRSAIRVLLQQLVIKAREVGHGFAWFVGTENDNLVAKVNAVYKNINELHAKLKVSAETLGVDGKTPAAYVDYAIEELTKTVDTQIGSDVTGDADKVTINPTHFSTYNAQVVQSKMSDKLKGDASEGGLPNKIGSIQRDLDGIFNGAPKVGHLLHADDSITTALSKFANKIEDLVSEASTNDGVKNYLIDLNEMISKGNNGEYHLTARELKTNAVKGLTKIYDELKALHNGELNTAGKIQNAIDAVLSTVTELEKVPERVKNEQKKAEKLMERVQEEIIERIHYIDRMVSYADKELISAIGIVDDAIRNARLHTLHAIECLETTLMKATKEAFKIVTTKTRCLFATHRQAELKAMKSLAENTLKEVANILEKDRIMGAKGLLKMLKTWFQAKNSELISAERMSSLTEKFKDLYYILHKYVKFQHDGLIVEDDSDENESQPQPSPPISGGGYRARPATPTDQSSTTTVATPPGRVGMSHTTPSTGQQPPTQPTKNPIATYLVGLDYHSRKLHNALTVGHFTHQSANICHEFAEFLDSVRPLQFGGQGNPLLDIIRSGLQSFLTELSRAYISKYCGAAHMYEWGLHGGNCAKVFMTSLEILVNDFEKLFRATAGNKKMQINVDVGNRLGVFFRARGYDVAKGASTQDGELQNTEAMTGEKIRKLCDYTITVRNSGEYDPKTQQLQAIDRGVTTFDRWIRYLYVFLSKYRSVCHIKHIAKPRTPTTINQMLHWVNGLPYTTVYNELTIQGFGELFEKPEEEESVGGEIVLKTEDDDKLSAYPEDITAVKLRETLTEVCRFSDRVLVCILGHGHAEGRYACDFSTNPDGLLYPSNASACLDMLVDILKRLYEQFYFLFIQCSREKDNVSWRDCWYGRHVGGSDWRCNERQCINQMVKQSADQKANHSCGQTCDRHPSCGLKSPLQSFLEDGLPGFLPHTIKKPGCKLDCTVSNHRGLPCKTPMGFGDISVTASRASRGERMMKLLDVFCGQQTSPLTKLCGYFNCLLQMPPQTLGDMFAFYYNFLREWNMKGQGKDTHTTHRKDAFEGALTKAYFDEQYGELDVSSLFSHNNSGNHTTRDLFSLVCHGDNRRVTTCGRYLQPFGINTWNMFSEKYADKYCSWIVYLTETLYKLLDQLYNECCNNCDKPGTRCYDKLCPKTCPVKYTIDETESKTTTDMHHGEDCKSIAHCPFTQPTLCKYGVVIKSFSNMSGVHGHETKRTCKDLCNALRNVLSDKISDNAPLAKLVHDLIPKFIWAIRLPFIWLNVALWLLSLLYLIHIMVIRLDLLHIKSHLHSPSSHRIAAQSLLAAARVNKLGKVFYLQP